MSPRKSKIDPRWSRRASVERRSSLERRPPGTRVERKRFLILCEGDTEEKYFLGMRIRGGPVLDVVNPRTRHLQVIDEAWRRRNIDDWDEEDEIWCVLDTELDRKLTLAMLEKAGDEIRLALSTPCFEFWLLLHHKDHRAPFQTAKEVEKAVKCVVPGWTKGSTRFADFREGVADACRRAKAIERAGEDPMPNPSTSVWRLVEAIRGSHSG